MNNIIREFREFEPDNETEQEQNQDQNFQERPYPYSFEFAGEAGIYRLEIAKDLQDFRVFFPEGKLIYSTTEALFAWDQDESPFGGYDAGLLWRWMRRVLMVQDYESAEADATKFRIFEKVNMERIDPPILFHNYTYKTWTGEKIHLAISREGAIQITIPGYDVTKNFDDLYKDHPEIKVMYKGGLDKFIRGKFYEITGEDHLAE